MQRAIGDRLTCVFVDHGLLRAGERAQVQRDFVAATGAKLVTVDAADTFLAGAGRRDQPGRQTQDHRPGVHSGVRGRGAGYVAAQRTPADSEIEFLVQGTLYPDVVESGGGSGTANIKSHHNVGGLPDDLKFKLVEPLRLLFKDEVRAVGPRTRVCPRKSLRANPSRARVWASGSSVKSLPQRLDTLRRADAIAREELTAAGLDHQIWQCPVVLLADIRSVGVQGDGRTYGHPIVLRPVSSEDAMTADWTRVPYEVLERISTRITNEVAEVNRVVLDVTSKPPGTIEWE